MPSRQGGRNVAPDRAAVGWERGRATTAKLRAAQLSVLSNTLLVLLKLGVGLWIGSVAVLSEAVHSGTDLVAAFVAFFAVRASDAPPDERHPYGHGKMESVSGVAEAVLILVAGTYIVAEAVRALIHGRESEHVGWGVGVMTLSALLNVFVARQLFRVARATDSIALEADAHHLSIDVWTSVGVVIGLALVWGTGLHLFDPLVALAVAFFILRTGWRILRGAFSPLLDEQLPPQEVRAVEAIMANHQQILGWHKLRTRKSGSQRHVDVHIQVDDDMSLKDAHRLTEELEDAMRDALPNLSVMIHTEPYEEEMRHHEENPH
jgi:cation diffusion facilitator family transporter